MVLLLVKALTILLIVGYKIRHNPVKIDKHSIIRNINLFIVVYKSCRGEEAPLCVQCNNLI